MTRFSTLHPDGTETDVRNVQQSIMLECPFCIMMPSHYRDDGSCKCDSKAERVRMKGWGYTSGHFRDKATKP